MDDLKEITGGERNSSFNFGSAVKQCLILVLISCALGLVFNLPMVVNSFDGKLLGDIQRKQLADLKAKAKQLSPDIRFIDLISAKKLFDEQQAYFLDARSPEEYRESAIAGALGISLMSVAKGEVDLESYLPDQESIIISYCSGGECDVSVEMAKELVDMGYRNIYVLGEGYPGWEEAGYPVFKPDQEVK